MYRFYMVTHKLKKKKVVGPTNIHIVIGGETKFNKACESSINSFFFWVQP